MKEVTVGIIGAGMAGLSAALRLAERGFRVKVYERNWFVGGSLGAHRHSHDDVYHEHCYHMVLNWYHNFWQIAKEIGRSRYEHFEPRPTTRYMYKDGRMPGLVNPGAPEHVLENLFSGVAPPPDMFLWAYSLIDLLTQRFRPGRLLEEYSVNSFMQSRPYASERSAMLHNHTLIKAFAVPSYLTSASSYKSFIKYSLHEPDPSLWVLKGDTQRF